MTHLKSVIASEAKQSAVYLLHLINTKNQSQTATPPCWHSKVPAIRVTRARSDASVTRHCERSEAIRSLSFTSIPDKKSKAGCRAPLSLFKAPRTPLIPPLQQSWTQAVKRGSSSLPSPLPAPSSLSPVSDQPPSFNTTNPTTRPC